jgi:hypothetical protein
VLADGVDGGVGLWALAGSTWTVLGATPGATALGRTADGIAIATGHDLDLRTGSELSNPGTVRTLKWSGATPTAPIVSLDYSPSGKLAVVTANDMDFEYAITAADGTLARLPAAPESSFAPLVAWLDDAHLLVLGMDKLTRSRLAVLDTGAHVLTLAQSLMGVRWYAVSADRRTVAAASDGAVWAGSVADLLGQTEPKAIARAAGGDVVWDMTLDADGSNLFMLSGTVGPGGTIIAIHELGYTRGVSGWTETLDLPVPFGWAIAQVYLA